MDRAEESGGGETGLRDPPEQPVGIDEIVGPRRISTNPIDKINYQHTLAYGAYRALPADISPHLALCAVGGRMPVLIAGSHISW